ncbi:radical SAM protein [Paraliomyxa miuraensis]|uniref:radical SAM protein n=1 Tax=Paraliomyxa miuraensis TaxID=376150 RepID=UPI002255007B|nr:radical SAM protein [Paraliomyxa miuraensis]MCX4241563.1 radical SAM protein [Paraliomyxa miuraensis]
MTRLTVTDHDRDAAGLTYVYPVVSRRAGGVSVGINLNPNNACNWRCVYCQVPGLVRGAAPPIDVDRLEAELRGFLGRAQRQEWLERNVEEPYRRVVDVAFSGNGEPTTSDQLDEIVARVLDVLHGEGLADLNKVLITNGSQLHRPAVQPAVERLGRAGGEAWFKFDSATAAGRKAINDAAGSPQRARENLRICAGLCRTRIQTCVIAIDGEPPSEAEQSAYLAFLAEELAAGTALHDVLLYGMARPPQQPGAQRLSRLPDAWLEGFAARIRGVGLPVIVRA